MALARVRFCFEAAAFLTALARFGARVDVDFRLEDLDLAEGREDEDEEVDELDELDDEGVGEP